MSPEQILVFAILLYLAHNIYWTRHVKKYMDIYHEDYFIRLKSCEHDYDKLSTDSRERRYHLNINASNSVLSEITFVSVTRTIHPIVILDNNDVLFSEIMNNINNIIINGRNFEIVQKYKSEIYSVYYDDELIGEFSTGIEEHITPNMILHKTLDLIVDKVNSTTIFTKEINDCINGNYVDTKNMIKGILGLTKIIEKEKNENEP